VHVLNMLRLQGLSGFTRNNFSGVAYGHTPLLAALDYHKHVTDLVRAPGYLSTPLKIVVQTDVLGVITLIGMTNTQSRLWSRCSSFGLIANLEEHIPVVSAVGASSAVDEAAAAEAAAERTAAARGRAGRRGGPSEAAAAARRAAARRAAAAAPRTPLAGVGRCPAGASDWERAIPGSCTEPAGLTGSPRRAEEPARLCDDKHRLV